MRVRSNESVPYTALTQQSSVRWVYNHVAPISRTATVHPLVIRFRIREWHMFWLLVVYVQLSLKVGRNYLVRIGETIIVKCSRQLRHSSSRSRGIYSLIVWLLLCPILSPIHLSTD